MMPSILMMGDVLENPAASSFMVEVYDKCKETVEIYGSLNCHLSKAE
jgi:hypothetical protein